MDEMAEPSPDEHPHLSSPSDTAIDVDGEEADILSPPLSSLREISTLASWTVSTYKPGCGVAALRNPSETQFWQSDGPQPHLLNIHFFKLVSIARLRIYLDLEADESYTPTRMQFLAGHSEYDVVEFAEWRAGDPTSSGGQAGQVPKGWVDIGLERCWGRGGGGGGDDDEANEDNAADGEGVLRCMFLQIKVLENHQNGKDTHIRGVQIWARDEREVSKAVRPPVKERSREKAVDHYQQHQHQHHHQQGSGNKPVWEDELEAWIDEGSDGIIR